MSAASTPAKRLIVCGGSGFLGSRVCKYAVARGWDVTSIRSVTLSQPRQPVLGTNVDVTTVGRVNPNGTP